MKLRTKTLLLISSLLVSLIAVLYGSLSTILLDSYAKLEEEHTRKNVKRVQKALKEEINQLNDVVKDLAGWNNAYDFVENRNQAFIEEETGNDTFRNQKINFFLVLNTEGKEVFVKGLDLETSKKLAIPESLQKKLDRESIIVEHTNSESEVQGILLLKENPLIIVSQPILNTARNRPIRGSMIWARYLNKKKIEELAKLTQLSSLMLYRLDIKESELSSNELKNIHSQLIQNVDNAQIITEPVDDDIIAGYSLLLDIYGEPALMLEIKIERDIYKQGQTSLFYLVISLFAVGVVFGFAIIVLLDIVILKRLTNLSKDVKNIGETKDLSMRVEVSGKDELSSLSSTINDMVGDLEKGAKKLAIEQEKAENLLLNILPQSIVDKLKQDQSAIAENFDEVTILFADIVGFTPLSARLEAIELVNWLNDIFSRFDHLAEKLRLEKIKTIGDAYMVAGGLPIPRKDHAEAIAEMALSMQEAVKHFRKERGEKLQIRIGINTGVVVAGVIGTKKFIYDLWGDAVNIASRMESSGEPGNIQVTESTYKLLKHKFNLKKRGKISVKGKGKMTTYWLLPGEVIEEEEEELIEKYCLDNGPRC
ncbi:MAG: HAMP domain-containing protein [Moorea sp. SIO2B7]|nr:HAMP domain-containing protein [Moorena sp. SIO2B7]